MHYTVIEPKPNIKLDHMNEIDSQFHELLLAEVRRRLLGESVPRLKKCLGELTEEEIWRRPNEHSNSVGNLVLHLCGNVRQWLLSGLGKQPDTRHRQAEFDERGPIAVQALIGRLDELVEEVEALLGQLRPEDLLAEHPVQTFRENGVSILVHVVEHFSYHTGQVSYIVKAWKDLDLGYYRGIELE